MEHLKIRAKKMWTLKFECCSWFYFSPYQWGF